MSRRTRRTDTPRNHVMTFRVTGAEKADLDVKAARAGMTTSGFIAALVTTRKVTFVEPTYLRLDPGVLHELRRIGNNLNQLAHVANSGLPPSIVAALEAARELISIVHRNDVLRQLAHEDRGPPDRQSRPAKAAEAFEATAWVGQLAAAIK